MNLLLIYFLMCLIFCAKVHLQNFNFVLKNNKLLIKSHTKSDIKKYVKNNKNDINSPDHALTFLTKKTTESCPFGLLPSPKNASHCKALLCHTNFDCETNFGQNTVCGNVLVGQIRICECDKTHTLDTENRCTVKVGNPLDRSCLIVTQCQHWVPNSECINGQCKCELGYVATANGAACKKVFCKASTEPQQGRAVCREHFGENVQCNYFNECSCDFFFDYDLEKGGCTPRVSPLGGACTARSNCSSVCLNGRCGCELGTTEDPFYSRYLCKKVPCTKDDQCRRHWPHSRCYRGNGGGGVCDCDDSAGYERNSSSQSCVPRFQLLGTACQEDGDCGREAHCVRQRCTCPAGWRPGKNEMDCEAIRCRADGECQQFGDANLVCRLNGCACRDGYFGNLGKCTWHIGNSDVAFG